MKFFRPLLIAWTLIGYGWMIYDTVIVPKNWYNFTSWTWLLQVLFYTMYLFAKNSTDHAVFLDGYFLPLVFACEWTAAIAVVYMMVAESTVIADALENYGPVKAWLGNFLIHYMTVVVLIVYMHKDQKKTFTCVKLAREDSNGTYASLLHIGLFTLIYSYCVFFPPASHYGITGMSDTITALLLLAVSATGLAAFRSWSLPGFPV